MIVKTMVMFTNKGTLEYKDKYRVVSTLQFHPFYVFDKCEDDKLGSLLLEEINKKYKLIHKFTVSFDTMGNGYVNVSQDNILLGKILFNYSDVIEYKNSNEKLDYYKLGKVLSI